MFEPGYGVLKLGQLKLALERRLDQDQARDLTRGFWCRLMVMLYRCASR